MVMQGKNESKPSAATKEAPRVDGDVDLLVAQAAAVARLLRTGLNNGEDAATIEEGLEGLITLLDEAQLVADRIQAKFERLVMRTPAEVRAAAGKRKAVAK